MTLPRDEDSSLRHWSARLIQALQILDLEVDHEKIVAGRRRIAEGRRTARRCHQRVHRRVRRRNGVHQRPQEHRRSGARRVEQGHRAVRARRGRRPGREGLGQARPVAARKQYPQQQAGRVPVGDAACLCPAGRGGLGRHRDSRGGMEPGRAVRRLVQAGLEPDDDGLGDRACCCPRPCGSAAPARWPPGSTRRRSRAPSGRRPRGTCAAPAPRRPGTGRGCPRTVRPRGPARLRSSGLTNTTWRPFLMPR